MTKSQSIAREMNRAISGKSEFFASAIDPSKYQQLASHISAIENVGIYWLGTASNQSEPPVAQVWQLRRMKRATSDHFSRVLGYLRRREDGTWYATAA